MDPKTKNLVSYALLIARYGEDCEQAKEIDALYGDDPQMLAALVETVILYRRLFREG